MWLVGSSSLKACHQLGFLWLIWKFGWPSNFLRMGGVVIWPLISLKMWVVRGYIYETTLRRGSIVSPLLLNIYKSPLRRGSIVSPLLLKGNMWSLGIYTKAFVKDRFFIPHCNLLSAPSFCVLGESPYLSWGFVLPDLTVYYKSRGLNVAFDTCNASPCCLIISLGIYIKTFVKRQFLHPHCNLHSAPGFCVPGESPYLREISGSLF